MQLLQLVVAGCAIVAFIKLVNSPLMASILNGGLDRATGTGIFAMLLATIIAIVKIAIGQRKDS